MSKDDLTAAEVKEVADALDRIVKDLPWGQSVFLSALGKKFALIQQKFQENVGLDAKNVSASEQKNDKTLSSGQMLVYVSVYNANGTDLSQWARIISNLTNQSISRPTYSDITQVKEMIRSKQRINNEGFVSVVVSDSDLLDMPEEKLPFDKLGHKLLVLKEKAIRRDNIKKFFHFSGIYDYKKGLLSKTGEMHFSED